LCPHRHRGATGDRDSEREGPTGPDDVVTIEHGESPVVFEHGGKPLRRRLVGVLVTAEAAAESAPEQIDIVFSDGPNLEHGATVTHPPVVL
jgi:hypothetical protein